jgi:riboflavin synthase
MFCGIVQHTAPVLRAAAQRGNHRVRIRLPRGWTLRLGQSVAVNGVCSTVSKRGQGYFEVEYMPETLAKTNVGALKTGSIVNLESSLRVGDFLDSHFVQGHVDARGVVAGVRADDMSCEIVIRAPKAAMRYIAPKGSVTVNGVALTVASLRTDTFTVALVPYTLAHTNLGNLKRGETVNIETDMLARYLARFGKR